MPVGDVATGGFLVAGDDGSEFPDLREKILDQMPPFVELPVEVSLDLSIRFRWDAGRTTPPSRALTVGPRAPGRAVPSPL